VRNRFRRGSLALLLLLVGATVLAQTAVVGPPPDLDAWVARSMKEFGVPGLSVGIVKDGKVVVSKGYGVREREYSVRHWLEH